MRGFWAVILFVLAVPLIFPGTFIWPLALLSLIMLSGAIAIVLSIPGDERRPVATIFAWTCGFLMLADVAALAFWGIFYIRG
ncbi:hypothetical protein Swit_4439 [Rhizorhabdus wittichii RW1]|uniref:Uncharacterized protein n=1 Tax=Rhizorhabdus wittichii (strain DSM 6014 / CCUG 31198 / JCM 15750 / NBRC 105917 / EY 4224 / RW1) TaxID=392499 RepID=A0A9J9HFR1_RHIWR|nr:hypothetical protein Swit_4439 [Rhizorhabdus wittichii RW1]